MAEKKFPEDVRAKRVKELYKAWSDARNDWEHGAREDIDFYLGNHWTDAEVEELASRNQSSLSVDRLYSAIEQFKAITTSRPPKFRAIAREDSDVKMTHVINTILHYIWEISDGNEMFKQVVHDYAICGIGYFYAYVDKESDYGRGDIKISHLDPFSVYVDPHSRNRYFDDASGIIVTNVLTKAQLLAEYTELSDIPEGMDEEGQPLYDKPLIDYIDSGTGFKDEDYPASNYDDSASFTPDRVSDYADGEQDNVKYRIFHHYDKIKVPYFRVKNIEKNEEYIVEFKQLQALNEEPQFRAAVGMGDIQIAEVKQTRIRCTHVLGQIVLYQSILNTDKYPVVPSPNIWTNTPYPLSDVSKGKDLQRFINKLTSLITSHAQSSAGLKLLVPQGSIQDMEQLERDWSNPTATIEYDASFGEPHFPSPQPLSQSIITLPKMIEGYIDLNMGIYEMQQGNADAAPRTASATMQLEDFGARRSKSKLRDIEGALKRLGLVVYNLAKEHYDYQKTFRLVQPNNDINEVTINEQTQLYDDFGNTINDWKNNLQVGQYDVTVVGNSTTPTNRWAEHAVYMEAFQMGLIDREEALKKSDIFDREGVQQRMSQIQQLQQQLASAQQQIKNLSGDLQTARRESVSARQRTEVEKFKANLNEQEQSTKSEARVAVNKLQHSVKLEEEKLRMATKEQAKSDKSQVSEKSE